jgi:hypothetical protein
MRARRTGPDLRERAGVRRARVERDCSGLVQRIAVDAAGDRREGHRREAVGLREREARGVRAREQRRGLAGRAIHRADRVDHVARPQAEAGRDPRLAGRAAHARRDLGHGTARGQQLGAGGRVDRTVDAAPAEHPLVRGVDDRIDGLRRQVVTHDRQPRAAGQRERLHVSSPASRTVPRRVARSSSPAW